MTLGEMNKKAQIIKIEHTIDSEGFKSRNVETLYSIRVFVEGRHGSERWANLAAFSEATELFRFRKIPGFTLTTKHFILYEGKEYNILSVEDVKGRKMYLEVLAKKVEASNG